MAIVLLVLITHFTTHKQRVVNAMVDTPFLNRDFVCLNAASTKDTIQIQLYAIVCLDMPKLALAVLLALQTPTL